MQISDNNCILLSVLQQQGIGIKQARSLCHSRWCSCRRRHMLPPLADEVATAMQMLPGWLPWLCICLSVCLSVSMAIWLFGCLAVWLPVASILNCYALDNLNTRRRKNKTRNRESQTQSQIVCSINAADWPNLHTVQLPWSTQTEDRLADTQTHLWQSPLWQLQLQVASGKWLYKVEACVEPPSW